MPRSTPPWLVLRSRAGARRLLDYLSGPGHVQASDMVEWRTLVAQACCTTGTPGPIPDANLIGWRGRNLQVAAGAHDVSFHVDKLRDPCQAKLRLEQFVVKDAGHHLATKRPRSCRPGDGPLLTRVSTKGVSWHLRGLSPAHPAGPGGPAPSPLGPALAPRRFFPTDQQYVHGLARVARSISRLSGILFKN